MQIEVDDDLVYKIMITEINTALGYFDEYLEEYRRGECPNIFHYKNPEADIDEINRHIEAFKLVKAYYEPA